MVVDAGGVSGGGGVVSEGVGGGGCEGVVILQGNFSGLVGELSAGGGAVGGVASGGL